MRDGVKGFHQPERVDGRVKQHTLCVNNERAPKSTAHRHAQW